MPSRKNKRVAVAEGIVLYSTDMWTRPTPWHRLSTRMQAQLSLPNRCTGWTSIITGFVSSLYHSGAYRLTDCFSVVHAQNSYLHDHTCLVRLCVLHSWLWHFLKHSATAAVAAEMNPTGMGLNLLAICCCTSASEYPSQKLRGPSRCFGAANSAVLALGQGSHAAISSAACCCCCSRSILPEAPISILATPAHVVTAPYLLPPPPPCCSGLLWHCIGGPAEQMSLLLMLLLYKGIGASTVQCTDQGNDAATVGGSMLMTGALPTVS